MTGTPPYVTIRRDIFTFLMVSGRAKASHSFGKQFPDLPSRKWICHSGQHSLRRIITGWEFYLLLSQTGNYSRLACEFYFVRSLGYYIIQIYVPSTLIVVLSWVSFWLSRDAVPARVALGITTVLTMTTLISSTNAALPKVGKWSSLFFLRGRALMCMNSLYMRDIWSITLQLSKAAHAVKKSSPELFFTWIWSHLVSDFLPKKYRCLFSDVLRYGLCLLIRICCCQLHWQ